MARQGARKQVVARRGSIRRRLPSVRVSAPLVALATVALLLLVVGSLIGIFVLLVGLSAGGLYFLYKQSTATIPTSTEFQKEHGRDLEQITDSENPELIIDAVWSLSSRLHQWDARRFTAQDRYAAEEYIEMAVGRIATIQGDDAKRLRALFFPNQQNYTLQ